MGKESRGTILILHGWRVPVERYFPLKNLFVKAGFQVFVPQLPGFADGEALTEAYSLDDYVKFVINFAKKERIENFFVVAHSFGGRVALKLSVLHPEKVKAIVLTGVPAIRNKSGKRLGFLILAKIGKTFCAIPPFCFFKQVLRKALYYFAGEWDYYKTKGAMRETFKKIVAEDLGYLLSKIKIPTLLIWGEKDGMVPVSIAKRIVDRILRAKLTVIPSVSHKLPYEKPKIFAEKCLEFFSSLML